MTALGEEGQRRRENVQDTILTVHGSLGVIEPGRVDGAIVNRQKALEIVDVAKNTDIHSVFVEYAFKGCLTRRAWARAGPNSVPGTMASNDHPRSHTSINTRQVCLEELDLLVWTSEWAAVEMSRPAWGIWGICKVGFGIDHHDMRHSIVERIPEWRLSKLLGLLACLDCRCAAAGLQAEGCWKHVREARGEIREILLSLGTQLGEIWDLGAVSLVVSGRDHIRFACGDWSELIVEALDNGRIGILAVQVIRWILDPIIGTFDTVNDRILTLPAW